MHESEVVESKYYEMEQIDTEEVQSMIINQEDPIQMHSQNVFCK